MIKPTEEATLPDDIREIRKNLQEEYGEVQRVLQSALAMLESAKEELAAGGKSAPLSDTTPTASVKLPQFGRVLRPTYELLEKAKDCFQIRLAEVCEITK